MIMHEKDEQLLRSFCDERCLKDVTYESYATAIGLYSRYHKKPFYQLLEEAEREKQEKEDELWFVDYCNNCKTGSAFKNDVACHHPWYCWHEGQAAIVQAEIVMIDEYRRLHGHVTSQMYWKYKELRKRQR